MRFNREDSITYAARAAAVFAVAALLCLLVRTSFAGDPAYETVYTGLLDREAPIKSTLIRSAGELDRAKEALGIRGALPPVDFGRNSLILITAGEGTGGAIDIKSIGRASGGVMEIRYTEELVGPLPRDGRKPAYPYLIARLSTAPGKGGAVRFVNDSYMNMPAPGTGIGQFKEYTNVLSGGADMTFAQFLPLEKGNTWTYRAETDEGSSEVTNSVVSESDGWSVFDKFFGISGVGMKIYPGVGIYVASKGGVKKFYSSDVVRSFPKTSVTTPAGDFRDVMVVSMPEGGDFWFRDVYAKGVGLVYHEQKSRKGRASYSLVSARVGGTDYPGRKTSGRQEN